MDNLRQAVIKLASAISGLEKEVWGLKKAAGKSYVMVLRDSRQGSRICTVIFLREISACDYPVLKATVDKFDTQWSTSVLNVSGFIRDTIGASWSPYGGANTVISGTAKGTLLLANETGYFSVPDDVPLKAVETSLYQYLSPVWSVAPSSFRDIPR